MIWRSRSFSARSSSSSVLSRPGSSGRAEAEAVTSKLDQSLQQLTIALTCAGEPFCSARYGGRGHLLRLMHPLPIQPFQKSGELRCREPHHTVLEPGPAECPLFETLGHENHPGPVPKHALDPVGTPHIIPHTVWGSRVSPTP